MRDDKFAPAGVVGAEKQPGERVGVDMALEPHLFPALDVEHETVAVVTGGADVLAGHVVGALEYLVPVRLVKPGQVVTHLVGVDAAAWNLLHVRALAGQQRRAREVADVGGLGYGEDLLLPAVR